MRMSNLGWRCGCNEGNDVRRGPGGGGRRFQRPGGGRGYYEGRRRGKRLRPTAPTAAAASAGEVKVAPASGEDKRQRRRRGGTVNSGRAMSSRSLLGEGCDSAISTTRWRHSEMFEDDSRFLDLSLQLLSVEWVHWQVSHGYCYLRYESVRAGRQGSRPKHEVCGCFIVVRARAGRQVSRPRSGSVDVS
ncbi:hypothetical protein Scep_015096 [Stephania cephalantha]|uniref:Uncharacterized protein n=1 Tax=Stephania cephalantha TaxID=152367 RepID=A0AAP0P2H2_9MAGN